MWASGQGTIVDGVAARSMRVLRSGCRGRVPIESRLAVEILSVQADPMNPTTVRQGRDYLQLDITSR